MARMTGGRAIVRSIIEHGVDTIFGLPGIQLDHLFNALHDERNSVRVIHPRHEQAAGYMAYGYAQSTGMTHNMNILCMQRLIDLLRLRMPLVIEGTVMPPGPFRESLHDIRHHG